MSGRIYRRGGTARLVERGSRRAHAYRVVQPFAFQGQMVEEGTALREDDPAVRFALDLYPNVLLRVGDAPAQAAAAPRRRDAPDFLSDFL